MSQFAITAIQAVSDAQGTVVPVVAQAGTALAPLIALAVTNTLGLLMRPKELARTLKAKPWSLLVVLALGGGIWWLVTWLMAPPAPAQDAGHPAPTEASTAGNPYQTDWALVALAILRTREEAALSVPTVKAPASAPAASVPLVPVSQGEPVAVVGTPVYFRGNAQRSGFMGGISPTGLKPAWNYYAKEERKAMVLSSPLVHNGLVYSASCLLFPPASYGTVSCVDLATGKERWMAASKKPIKNQDFVGFFSSPAITADGKRLVIGQGLHTDYDADLVCLDAQTGAIAWIVPTALHIECSPCIEGDIVVVGAGAVEQGDDHKPVGDPLGRGHPGFVLGVRVSTGEVLFRHPVNDPEGSPILEHGICYIGSGMNGSKVTAFRADLSDAELTSKGLTRELWTVDTPYPATGAVTVTGDTVLIGCGKGDFVFAAKDPEGQVIALDKKTGAKQWSTVLPDAILGAIAVSGSTAVVPCRNGEVIAIDLTKKGAERWRARINKQSPVLAGPAITETHVYAVSNDGYMVVLNAADGKQIERVYLNAKGKPGEMGLSTSSPLVVDGKVVVGSETGGLRCFAGTTP